MKQNIYRAIVALLMVAGAAEAGTANLLTITETGETATGITATYDGSPVSVTLTGPADNWTIQLPARFQLTPTGGNSLFVGEPESATEVNEIDITQPSFLTWQSDIPVPAGVTGPFHNPLYIEDAGVFISANAVQPFDLLLYDQPEGTVPDASSTGMLLGLALVGLCGVARFGRVRHEAV